MYTGVAFRMAQALRLGRAYYQKHTTLEREVRKRTMWTCFILDRVISFITARPQMFQATKLQIGLPCSEQAFLFEEETRCFKLTELSEMTSEYSELLPYFVKAIELWGVMTDLFKSSNSKGDPPDDGGGRFFRAEAAIKMFISRLPAKMEWSVKNYRTYRILGQGCLFVSLHFMLHHSFCLEHLAYLPNLQRPHSSNSAQSPADVNNISVASTCLYHADEITRMASTLHGGDEADRQMLFSPMAGLAILGAATVHLWSLHFGDQMIQVINSGQNAIDGSLTPRQNLSGLSDILQEWAVVWPIALSWLETIESLEEMYAVACGEATIGTPDDALNLGKDIEEPETSDPTTFGSGLPEPEPVQTFYERICNVILSGSLSSMMIRRQTRLHIQSLWRRIRFLDPTTSGDLDLGFEGQFQTDLQGLSEEEAAEIWFSVQPFTGDSLKGP
jgi:hypothetical protein